MNQRSKAQHASSKHGKLSKKGWIAVFLVSAIIICVGVGGTIAYFTDKTDVENTFVFGEVDITPHEPNFPPNDPPDTPNEETPKDPTIANTGSQDAIVFMEVQVPVEDVILVNANGGLSSGYFDKNGAVDKASAKPAELFLFNSNDAASKKVGESTYNSNWVLLDTTDGKTGGYATYRFGYTKVLAGSDKTFNSQSDITEFPNTEPLFDSVRMKNFLEGTLDTSRNYNVIINTYAVQAAYLSDENGNYMFNDGNENGIPAADRILTEDNLREIWQIYATQTQPAA